MSDENQNDAAEQWRKEQLEKFNSNPDEAMAAIKTVLGDELFEKTFGKPEPEQKKEPEHKPQVDADGTTVLNMIDRMNRLPKEVDKAMETLQGMPFSDEVKRHVSEELEKLPVSERAELTQADILGYTRLVAGLVALKHMEAGNKPPAQKEQSQESEEEAEQKKPAVPDDMKAPRATIMAMKDALLSHGYTEEQVEAMCND